MLWWRGVSNASVPWGELRIWHNNMDIIYSIIVSRVQCSISSLDAPAFSGHTRWTGSSLRRSVQISHNYWTCESLWSCQTVDSHTSHIALFAAAASEGRFYHHGINHCSEPDLFPPYDTRDGSPRQARKQKDSSARSVRCSRSYIWGTCNNSR